MCRGTGSAVSTIGRAPEELEMNDRSYVRIIALAFGGSFLVATILQVLVLENVLVQPPAIPSSASVVERVTALEGYRHDSWPLYFAANAVFGLGFFMLTALAIALFACVSAGDVRRLLLVSTLGTAGVVGLVEQAVLIGTVKVAIDIPSCDCALRTEEIVSRFWAEQAVRGAVRVLVEVAVLLGAAGLLISGRLFGGTVMPRAWAILSFGTAALLAISVGLEFLVLGGLAGTWLGALASGILIPIWALWIWRSFGISRAAAAAP